MEQIVDIGNKRRSVISEFLSKEVLIEEYLRQADVSEGTKKTYRKGLKNFTLWLEENNVNYIDKSVILEYKYDSLTKYAPNTVNGYLASVKALFKYLEEVGIAADIAKNVKGAKVSKLPAKEALTVEQVLELLDSFNTKTLKGKRDYALLNLMINTGLRVMEVQSANVEDISQIGGKTVLYIQGKGRDSKDNFVLLSNDVFKAILSYLEAREDREGALFKSVSNNSKGERLTKGSISRIVKTSFRNIGLDSDRLTAHSTRHTAVTLSLLGGATVQEAQAMARHADINTTMVYSHNINRIENSAETNISSLLSEAREEAGK